jgi:hypothetical protein
MLQKMELFIARQRLGKHILAEANARNNIGAVFSVVSTALVATQWCSKHHTYICINESSRNIEKTVFSVGGTPRLYNLSSRQRGCYIRTITASVQLKKESLVVGLKGPDAKTN